MEVNQGETIIGLIQCDVRRRVGDLGLQTDLCVILGENVGGIGRSGGDSSLLEVFLDHDLLVNLVDEALTVGDKKGSHDVEGRGDGECDEAEAEVEGKTGEESVVGNGGRSGEEVVEGENCT